MKTSIRLFCLLFLFLPFRLSAQEEQIDNDFVISSILVASPGDGLYSRSGHVAIRMRCPQEDLDYVFSYESEDSGRLVLRFLAGKLKMGLFAVPFPVYSSLYEEDGRGISEYVLNLPVSAKRNLWRVLDEHVAEGIELPYDYIKRGCAFSTLSLLKEGISPLKIEYGPWPSEFSLSRRELTENRMAVYPWTWCFLNLICNGSIDWPCTREEKVIMPDDLVLVLGKASVSGEPLLGERVELRPVRHTPKTSPVAPVHVALLILLLTVVFGLLRWKVMDYVLLAIQTFIGLVTIYLVFFSSLVCTEWSWLIVPFNPLPLIFWKWRSHWRIPFAAACLIWAGVMAFWPHTLTDWTYIVLAISIAIAYIIPFVVSKKNK